MRTTLNIDDTLMRSAKQRAAMTGQTLTHLIEAAIRERLAVDEATAREPFKLKWIPVEGRVQPSVDLTDRDALIARMGESL